MTEEQMAMLEDLRFLHNKLLEELDAINISHCTVKKRINIHLSLSSFLERFSENGYGVDFQCELRYPYAFFVHQNGFYFFALSETRPQKEKPLEGAEVI